MIKTHIVSTSGRAAFKCEKRSFRIMIRNQCWQTTDCGVQSGPVPVLVTKLSLEHGHAPSLHIVCGYLRATRAGLGRCNRN